MRELNLYQQVAGEGFLSETTERSWRMAGRDQDKTCFVIAPIGEEGSEIRLRSDKILRHIIEPAAKTCGYKTVRADKISEPGIITSQIIQHLVDDELVVADLSGHNPNVFYELAIRHVVRKPVVQLIQKGELIPFDVSAIRTIRFDYQDLDSAAQCHDDLLKQIRAAEKDPTDVDTPVTMAIDLQSLHRSTNPLEKGTMEIVSLLQDLRARIETLVHSSSETLRNEEALGTEMMADLARYIISKHEERSTSRPSTGRHEEPEGK
jgi:hypothetical protein